MNIRRLGLIGIYGAILSPTLFVQSQQISTSSDAPQARSQPAPGTVHPLAPRPFSTLGFAVKASDLGLGIDIATPVSPQANLRVGGSVFSLNRTLTRSGLVYSGNLRPRAVEAEIDVFPFRNQFHVTSGVVVSTKAWAEAAVRVPGGNVVTLNGTKYLSSLADPIHGSSYGGANRAGLKIAVGWGNLVPRRESHFSFPVEVGMATLGEPRVSLRLSGSVCDPSGRSCRSIASDPVVQRNVAGQAQLIANTFRNFQYFPIATVGISYNIRASRHSN